jgi:hypothetical protein
MNARNSKIEEARRLEKRINAWKYVAMMADRIKRTADARSRAYAYEQRAVINEIYKNVDIEELETKKEINRRNFEIEL